MIYLESAHISKKGFEPLILMIAFLGVIVTKYVLFDDKQQDTRRRTLSSSVATPSEGSFPNHGNRVTTGSSVPIQVSNVSKSPESVVPSEKSTSTNDNNNGNQATNNSEF